MLPNIDPKKMQSMLKKMGMKMDNISANQVIIKTDTGDITIAEPQVIKTTMQGQVVFQISGNVEEQKFSDDDVKLVIEQTGINDKKLIEKTLQETNGDIVETIMKLKKK